MLSPPDMGQCRACHVGSGRGSLAEVLHTCADAGVVDHGVFTVSGRILMVEQVDMNAANAFRFVVGLRKRSP